MIPILLAIGGQFLNALVAILDKYIVSDKSLLPKPFVYAFYSCLMTGGWGVVFLLGLIPGLDTVGVPSLENIQLPTIQVVGMSFLSAYTFFIALVSMYDALRRADASITMPIIGAISALATFGLSYLFLDFNPSQNFVWGVVLLSVGTALVARTLPKFDIIMQVFHSGLFFALNAITMKSLFLETNFDDGFFWSRIGLILFALSLLLVPVYFEKIVGQTKETSRKVGGIVLFNKIMAGIATFMLLKATDLSDPTTVQALGGLQYIFILLIGVLFIKILPASAVDSDHKTQTILRRMLYMAVILIGFVFLFA
jgi:drug/metabolite transporter (DMT)-like permease